MNHPINNGTMREPLHAPQMHSARAGANANKAIRSLGATAPHTASANNPEPIMTLQKPAKPAKAKLMGEDYSTSYVPPLVKAFSAPANPKPVAQIDMMGMQITDDPLPQTRCKPIYKYNPIFDAMKIGQSLKVPTKDIGKVTGALRKYIKVLGKSAHVKSVQRYGDDTAHGRVWMLAGKSGYLPRKQPAKAKP